MLLLRCEHSSRNAEKIELAKPISQSFHGFIGLTSASVSGLEIRHSRSFDRANKSHIFHHLSRQRILPSRIAGAHAGPVDTSEKKDSRAAQRGAGKKNVKFPNLLRGSFR
jgi:hypothetical protein